MVPKRNSKRSAHSQGHRKRARSRRVGPRRSGGVVAMPTKGASQIVFRRERAVREISRRKRQKRLCVALWKGQSLRDRARARSRTALLLNLDTRAKSANRNSTRLLLPNRGTQDRRRTR